MDQDSITLTKDIKIRTRTQSLQQIIEQQNHLTLSFSEASEIGESLVSFFNALGSNNQDENSN